MDWHLERHVRAAPWLRDHRLRRPGIGLTGVLRPWAIMIWLCALALLVRRELAELYKLGGMRVEKLFKKGSSKFNEARIAHSHFDAIVPRALDCCSINHFSDVGQGSGSAH
jgi:hypothetical protein